MMGSGTRVSPSTERARRFSTGDACSAQLCGRPTEPSARPLIPSPVRLYPRPCVFPLLGPRLPTGGSLFPRQSDQLRETWNDQRVQIQGGSCRETGIADRTKKGEARGRWRAAADNVPNAQDAHGGRAEPVAPLARAHREGSAVGRGRRALRVQRAASSSTWEAICRSRMARCTNASLPMAADGMTNG